MLTDARFWRDTLARVGRQVVQTIVPILLVTISTTGLTGVDLPALGCAAALAALVTLLRAFTGLRASPSSRFPVEAADRAVAAGAGTLLGLVTADGFNLLQANWSAIGITVLGSVAMSLLAMFTNTPRYVDNPVIPGDTAEPDEMPRHKL